MNSATLLIVILLAGNRWGGPGVLIAFVGCLVADYLLGFVGAAWEDWRGRSR